MRGIPLEIPEFFGKIIFQEAVIIDQSLSVFYAGHIK